MAHGEPSSVQPNVVSDPPPRPHLTAIDSAPPGRTEPEWPVLIVRTEIPQLIVVLGREQWESDVGLHWQKFTCEDIMIDSLGRVFAVYSTHDGLVWAGTATRSLRVTPLAKSVSPEDFRSFLVSHLRWSGCDVEDFSGDSNSQELSIGALIMRLADTVFVILESDSEYGPNASVREAAADADVYEPPQFSIRAILVILTLAAVACSAVASNYFGFGSLQTLLIALFTCAVFLLLLWIVVGAHTDSHH